MIYRITTDLPNWYAIWSKLQSQQKMCPLESRMERCDYRLLLKVVATANIVLSPPHPAAGDDITIPGVIACMYRGRCWGLIENDHSTGKHVSNHPCKSAYMLLTNTLHQHSPIKKDYSHRSGTVVLDRWSDKCGVGAFRKELITVLLNGLQAKLLRPLTAVSQWQIWLNTNSHWMRPMRPPLIGQWDQCRMRAHPMAIRGSIIRLPI